MTEALYDDQVVPRFKAFERQARRKLAILDAASQLSDLLAVPGNRLEQLKGNLSGRYSIRINDQWRLVFVWFEGNAEEVEIIDYH